MNPPQMERRYDDNSPREPMKPSFWHRFFGFDEDVMKCYINDNKVEKPADWTPPNNIYIGLEVAEERGSPLNQQVGGDHYKKLKIQPVEYNHANGLDFFQGSVVKYITRFRDKNGKADLEKAKHFIELLIELEYGKTTHTED